MENYSFVTIWKIKAPVEEVFNTIHNSDQWPDWWKGVEQVTRIKKGKANGEGTLLRYTFRGVLPYSLSFQTIITQIDRNRIIVGKASGELEGEGRWEFTETNQITTTTYYWDVRTTKRWMNVLSPVLKPVFQWNHDWIMKNGLKGICKTLNCEHL